MDQDDLVAAADQDAQHVREVAVARDQDHDVRRRVVAHELEYLDQDGDVGRARLAGRHVLHRDGAALELVAQRQRDVGHVADGHEPAHEAVRERQPSNVRDDLVAAHTRRHRAVLNVPEYGHWVP